MSSCPPPPPHTRATQIWLIHSPTPSLYYLSFVFLHFARLHLALQYSDLFPLYSFAMVSQTPHGDKLFWSFTFKLYQKFSVKWIFNGAVVFFVQPIYFVGVEKQSDLIRLSRSLVEKYGREDWLCTLSESPSWVHNMKGLKGVQLGGDADRSSWPN